MVTGEWKGLRGRGEERKKRDGWGRIERGKGGGRPIFVNVPTFLTALKSHIRLGTNTMGHIL